MANNALKVGGASGFWGDAAHATAQLISASPLREGTLDYIVYDYLAEITMSLLARARDADPAMGYAVSFVTEAMVPNLKQIAAQGIRIISNAGGVNPKACAEALESAIAEQGLELKVAWIEGDDLIDQKQSFAQANTSEMFSGTGFPPVDSIKSINAYLGAFPIAEALNAGADIVVTGRCVDSAVTLGACIHHFRWRREDLDKLAMGSLAGHILECGVQTTGGNFTDWQQVPNRENIGYPIVDISDDGSFVCSKPAGTGGLVSVATVAEQMVYEIGDPAAYALPDVVCDFTHVTLELVDDNQVLVKGAKGLPAPDSYKTSLTYNDQYRGGTYISFYGMDADQRAVAFADCVFKSARAYFQALGMPDFSETSVELIGAESQFGAYREQPACRELVMKIAAKHPQKIGVGIMLKQLAGMALATPPGLSGFAGNSPKIVPVVRLFSMLVPKQNLTPLVHIGRQSIECPEPQQDSSVAPQDSYVAPTTQSVVKVGVPYAEDSHGEDNHGESCIEVPLVTLAWARSGDKGNHANIGVIARKPEFLPYIHAALTTEVVANRFAHFFAEDETGKVETFQLPGIHAINFLLHNVLGGGGIASLRNDPQAKGYSQLLLTCPVSIPKSLAETIQ